MTAPQRSRWLSVYMAAVVVAWLAFLSIAGVHCPSTPPSRLPSHIAPAAVCQLKAMFVFWSFLCAMSIAGIPLIKRSGWRGRTFYAVAVLLPTLLVALPNVL